MVTHFKSGFVLGLCFGNIAVTCAVAYFVTRFTCAHEQVANSRQVLLADPSIETCPTSNCPAPPRLPVLSTQFIHGSTTKGASQPEWLSNIGLFVKTGNPDGQKVAQYIGVMQQEGAGTVWALNTDTVRNAGRGGPNRFDGFEGSGRPGRPGAVGARNGSIGYELDFTNWDATSVPGSGAFTVGEYVHAQGSYTSLSALYFDANMAKENSSSGWTDGILFNGNRLVSDNTIVDATHSRNSLLVAGSHSTGLNTVEANADMRSVAMKEGQSICFNELSDCFSMSEDKLVFYGRDGKPLFSISENGDAHFAGHVYSR